ncbi:MAG TPA: diguanylate cyclase [Gammaproteobacteria bacterium]|nr:diguanylate cyclase [Gammaproteobacteria bacterium]
MPKTDPNTRGAGRRPSSLPRLNYLPRTLLLLQGGAMVLVVMRNQPWPALFLALWALEFLVWPHVAYFRTRFSADGRRAECNNLLIDALTFGVWTAQVHFLIWLGFCFLAALILSNLAAGGVRSLLSALATYAAGCFGGGLALGFRFDLMAGVTDELAGLVAGSAVLLLLGLITHQQTQRLLSTRRKLRERNRVFESLLDMGIAEHGAGESGALIRRCLGYLAELMPEAGFGVILYQRDAPQRIHRAEFLAVDRDDRSRLGESLAATGPQAPLPGRVSSIRSGETLHLMPLSSQLQELGGILVVRAQRLEDRARATLQLFIDQLSATLQSSLVTARLERLANTDPLTGVYNRVFFREALTEAIAARQGSPAADFALLLVDIDGLKRVNDLHGHGAGDALIRAVARMLSRCVRDSDTLVRLGGDEFVILSRGCGQERADTIAERIRTAARGTWVHAQARNGARLRIGVDVSLGVAATDSVSPEELMQVADERMYADKQAHYARKEAAR